MADKCDQDQIQKDLAFLGFGHYRITEDGTFLQCDAEARRVLGIPDNVEDLSEYSIQQFCVVPSARLRQLKKLAENPSRSVRDVLSVRIHGQYKNLFDISWCCSEMDEKQRCYLGMIAEIKPPTLSPLIFELFPIGLYEVDEYDKIVHVNGAMVSMLNYQKEDQLFNKHLEELWLKPEELKKFNRDIAENGFAKGIFSLRDANNSKIKVEIFSQYIRERERYGMVTNVTQREQYYQAMENMPTGYFHIEDDKITHCNDHFARQFGYGTKKQALGRSTRLLFVEPEAFEEYMLDLSEADRRGEPLQNYPLKIRKADSGDIITISVDSLLVKDEYDSIIGQEGTIRDITEEIVLREKVALAEENLKKTTEDINKLTHTFLHPVIKFSGNSELQFQMAKVLHHTVQPKISTKVGKQLDTCELGEKLLSRMNAIRNDLSDTDEKIPLLGNSNDCYTDGESAITMRELKSRLKKICNIFDHRLRTIDSTILLEDAIRDTTLRLLEELNQLDFSNNELLRVIISKEFIEFLQNILFNSLIRGAKLLLEETEIMKQKVEALRSYFGFKKERKFIFVKEDISLILEKNLQQFEPVFKEKELKIDYTKSGNLMALISANDIDRVICNLLHNAWKYSHHAPGRFVKVRAKEMGDINQVAISIENFGIPIKQEEIKSGKIWEVGYRGEKAYESDRDGTGVGLADCRDVIDAHGGKIEITSVPAMDEVNPPKYKVPYLTKVIITIPKSTKKNQEDR